MKCDRCQENDATVHLSSTINGEKTEHHLCEQCAHEMGINNYFGSVGNLFGSGHAGGSVFNTTGGIPAFGGPSGQQTTCDVCGQTFDDFRGTGLFGCSNCYEAFADRLDPVMRRVQGSARHVGRKICQSADQQEQNLLRARQLDLRKSLEKAVSAEEYEKAARLRDEIRVLENRICSIEEDKSATPSKQDSEHEQPEGGEGE